MNIDEYLANIKEIDEPEGKCEFCIYYHLVEVSYDENGEQLYYECSLGNNKCEF